VSTATTGSGKRTPAVEPTSGTTRRRRPRRLDWSDDSGQVGGVEVLPFSILVFVVGTLLVTNAWAVVDVKLAVDAASREGARAYVEAPDAAAAPADAGRAARDAIAAQGRDPASVTLDLPSSGSFARCNRVVVTASYPVPAISLPIIGTHGEAFHVTASHSEIVDPYRSGAGGEGGCR
jgi:hypothetical protein